MSSGRTPEWVWAMQLALWKYALPFLFGPLRRPGEAPILRGGSAVTVQLDSSQFIVSAKHVVLEAMQACREQNLECFVGKVRVDLDDATISLGADQLDLATVQLTPRQIELIEETEHFVVRPVIWPP